MISTARPEIDLDDEPVWRFLAAVAVSADPQEQQDLVTAVREKVLENVVSAKKLKTSPELAALKIVSLASPEIQSFTVLTLVFVRSETLTCY